MEEKTMKKLITLVLAMVLALSLAACGSGDETPSKTESTNGGGNSTGSTGKWVLVNTETAKVGETDYVKFSGEKGNYENLSTTDNQGSGKATATISEPPSEIKPGDEISFQINGNYTGDFPFNWEYSANLGFTENYFAIEDSEQGYSSYRVKFGVGDDLKSSNSETVKLKAIKAGETGKTVEIRTGLSASGDGISTKYTYEWQAGN